MKRKNFVSRSLALLLALVMMLGFVPVLPAAEAAEGETEPIVLDFMSFAEKVSSQALWKNLRATSARGVKALGMKYGEQPSTKYTQAVKTLETWMKKTVNWQIPDLYTGGNGHFNHQYGGRRIYIDSYSGKYGIRLDTDQPQKIGDGENQFYITFDVPAGKGGIYAMSVESFDEAVNSAVPTCDGTDKGGATACFYLNDEQVWEEQTFAAETDGIVTRDYKRVELQEGTNTLKIHITGDRYGNETAGTCALNLRNITFGDPGPECLHENTFEIYSSNNNRTHKLVIKCDCGEKISEENVACKDSDDEDTLCDSCGFDMYLRGKPTRTFGKDSIVVDVMDFAYNAVRQPWFYELVNTDLDGARSIGTEYGTELTATEIAAIEEAENYLLENYNWTIEDLTSGTPYYTHKYGGRYLIIDSVRDYYGVRFYTHIPGNTASDLAKLKLDVNVPAGKSGWYDMHIETFDEATSSVVPMAIKVDRGGAVCDVYVNDELVCDNYLFAADTDGVRVKTVYAVYLEEGENSIDFHVVTDRNGTTNNGRRTLNLRSIELEPVGPCQHTKTSKEVIPNERDQMHTVKTICTCRQILSEITEPCVDVDSNKICDVCKQVMDMRGPSPYTFPESSVVIDFMQFAYEARQQDWWYGLRPASNKAGAKSLCGDYGETISEDMKNSITAMEQWLDENTNWNIEDLTTGSPSYLSSGCGRQIYIDSFRDYNGIHFYTHRPGNTSSDISKLKLEFEVPEEQAGPHALDICVFNTADGSPNGHLYDRWDKHGATVDVYVNGKMVVSDYCFTADTDVVEVLHLGQVDLIGGTNYLTIDVTGDLWQTPTAGRSGLSLRYIEFKESKGIETAEYLTQYLDLNEYYMPYGKTAAGFTVQSDDPWIASVSIDSKGMLSVTGVRAGQTTLQVYNGSELYCSIPVTVTSFEGSLDNLAGAPAKLDFVTTVDRAKEQSWFNGTGIVSENSTFNDWLKEHAQWHISEAELLTANADSSLYGFAAKGKNTFSVTLPADGLYNVTVEYLQGGGTMDLEVNGKVLYKDLSTAGEAATVKRSLGVVELHKGENTLLIQAAEEVYLRSVVITPLSMLQAEVGMSRYLNLNESYLAYDAVLSAPMAVSSNPDIAQVRITEDGTLVISGLSEGNAVIKVSDNGNAVCTVYVKVLGASALQQAIYTLDGFSTATLTAGERAHGDLSAITMGKTPMTEAYLRDAGSVYFQSSDSTVAKVNQDTGDVICVSEGTAVISAYVMLNGITVNASAVISVTDDTDLAIIKADAPVNYVSRTGTLQMTVSGQKESGLAADMNLYPVSWSVDDIQIATISSDGKLTGLKKGTVTVTVTANVEQVVISDTIVISVVDGTEVSGGDDVIYEFSWSRLPDFLNYTLDDYDIVVNHQQTTATGVKVTSRGIYMDVVPGAMLAMDFRVPKSGWYEVEVRGSQQENVSVYSNAFVDDTFVGGVDFDFGGTNGVRGGYNTMWLDAGVHMLKVVSTEAGQQDFGGLRLYATTDPNEVEVTLAAEKQELIVGEKMDLTLTTVPSNDTTFSLLQQDAVPTFTNYYTLSSSDPGVLTVSGMSVTAKAAGTADVLLQAEVDGTPVTRKITVSVYTGTVATAKITAEHTTVKPDAAPFQLHIAAYGSGGKEVELPAGSTVSWSSDDDSLVMVDESGIVTVQGKEGAAQITAVIHEGGHTVETKVWITVTAGKTQPTIYTYEERAIAQENALIYDWAWQMKEDACKLADLYVERIDVLYKEAILPQIWPGNEYVAYQNDENGMICPYCKMDLSVYHGYYPWIVDPVNNPWKVTCPHCDRDFPSNDFRSYYFSGLGDDGLFHEEMADPKYLVNELYPEMGEGWGVDDGWGWELGTTSSTGVDQVYTFIAHFIRKSNYNLTFARNAVWDVLDTLREAYLYTGDEKYGNAGAILIDRIADIYPTWDLSDFPIMRYVDNDGNGGGGTQFGHIADGLAASIYAMAADAFWDCLDNQEVIDYISQYASWKGMAPEDITPDYLRNNMDKNLLLKIKENLETYNIGGNFGIPQSACAYTAVALDRMPETQEMIEWLFNDRELYGDWMHDISYATGGGLLTTVVNEVMRDGLGNEGSLSYNGLWEERLLMCYEALAGYDRVSGADMWKVSKAVAMYHAGARLMTSGVLGPNMHETAGRYQSPGMDANIEHMTTAFVRTGDRTIARAIYAFNGNTTAGIHGDIFTKDPEHGIRSQIEEIVQEDGGWEMAKSDMMPHYGLAMLKEGPSKYLGDVNAAEYSSFWMYFGETPLAHHQQEILNLDLAAFGLTLSGNMGYPLLVTSNPNRLQWIDNTISNNTVVVNDLGQVSTDYSGFPLHFADDGKAKVMDANVPNAYEETDIYRRTVVAVENGNGVHYAVDFFRVLGGSEHVYAFHAASQTDPETEGLNMVKQPFGTYMGPDVEFGPDPNISGANGCGSGYSWLYNVARDDSPETVFSVDWPIKDFYNQVPNSDGIHLKLTMLSEEPMTEVATADGQPPQDSRNPDYLEFLMVRRSGVEGMDTLFTTVIEPYQFESYVAETELVDVVLINGTENVTDRAAAVKVTLTSGRVDYIVYATNTECTYRVADLFDFKGFAGVVSYEDGLITYAWGEEAAIVTDLITNAQPRITGEVLSFTEGLADSYEMTISMDYPFTAEELQDQWIYVNNDGKENGAYRVDGAEVNGNTAVIDLSFQTLVRGYVDKKNLDRGFVHNISVGDTYTIPLTTSFDEGQLFHHVSDTVVKTGSKLSAPLAVSGSSATYELEGAPAGMKLDASGTLIWAPAKAQAGRYPITVKAVKDGEVIGETSFIVYAVAYSGSSYGADVCTHAKAVTYEVDGVIENVCPACGMIEKTGEETVIEKFDVAGANMTLGNELKLNILVENEKLDDGDYTVKITHDGQTVEKALVPYNSSYAYAAYSVCAKQMSDVITAEVYKDGVAVSNVYETSVRNYAMNILNNGQLGKAVKTLVVDMLNYGAEAQKFFDYNASDLANASLNAAQKDLATKTVECKNYQVKGKNFYGANVSLEDRIILNLFFKNCEDGMTATVSYTGYDGTAVSVDAQLVQYKNDIYKVAIDEIVLADAFSPVTVTVYKDGAEFGSATDSVESYVARTGDSAINEAIMKFAYSAKQYLS